MIVWLLILALVTLYLYVEWSPADVDQSILKHQASVPPVRSPGESGVYRSTDTPHTTPLLHEILGKHFRNFNIGLLWEPEGFSISDCRNEGHIDTVDGFALRVYKLGSALAAQEAKSVVVTLPVGVEALAMVFACGLFNIDITFAEPEDAESAKQAAGADLVVAEALAVDSVTVADRPEAKPATVAFFSVENGLRQFSAREVGLSVASQLRALGHRMWSRQDRVLVFPTCQNPYALLMQLTALSAKAQLVFVDHTLSDPFRVIEFAQPTVLVTDDVALESLQRHVDDFNVVQYIRYGWAKLRLGRGKIERPIYPEFASLRLIHSCNLAGVTLTTAQANAVRIVTGSQLVHAFRVPKLFMPLFQTAFGDYRATPNLTSLVGPPTPGIEVKVVGAGNRGRLFACYEHDWVDTETDVYLRGDGCALV